MLLIYILIILFVFFLGYQAYLEMYPSKTIEGLENELSTNTNTEEYKAYDLNDPNNSLILSQKNAGNIEILKGKIDILEGVNKKVDNIQRSVDSMQIQIDGLIKQQADYAQELAGSTPPTITGTNELTVEEVENSIEQG